MRHVNKALATARKYAAGGRVDETPMISERPGLIPEGYSAEWAQEQLLPPRGDGIEQIIRDRPTRPRRRRLAALADGGAVEDPFAGLDPISRMKLASELEGRYSTPEEKRTNAGKLGYEVLSALPITGNAISAYEVPQAARDTFAALRAGRRSAAAGNAILTALNTFGAVTGLPWGRWARDAAKGGGSRLNTFVGPEARTADHDALLLAEDMRAMGKDRAEIRRETGWEWDERGLPIFEVDDSAATLRPPSGTQPQTMADFMDHPALFAARPDLAEMKFTQNGPAGSGAFYEEAPTLRMPPRIDVGPGNERKRLDVAMHELQHAADKTRGGSSGANARYATDEAQEEAAQAMRGKYGQAFADYEAAKKAYQSHFRGAFATQTPEVMEAARNLGAAEAALAKVQGSRAPVTPTRYAYHHNPGEVRARNVEARRTLTAAERRDAPPWETIDVDEADILSGRHGFDAPSQVFVPGYGGDKAEEALKMRNADEPMRDIWNKTRRVFAPDGSLRREIPDAGMRLDPDAVPGDFEQLGDLVEHDALFKSFPNLRKRLLRLTDATDTAGNPVVRNTPDGVMELSLESGDIRGDLAKLLQYDINKHFNYAAPIRHGNVAVENALRRTLNAIDEADVSPGYAASVAGAKAPQSPLEIYRGRINSAIDQYHNLKELGSYKKRGNAIQDAGQSFGRNNAGNIDAKIAKMRADATPDDLRIWPYTRKPEYFGKPRMQGNKGLPAFEDMTVLPPDGMAPGQTMEFIQRWHKYGAGKGKFAAGGRVARAVSRAKAITGGVRGKTGGRTDALPVDVPAGSYVVPADVVGALGEGNTEAGMHALDRQFPARGTSRRGATVPILISDGEYVVSPSAVRRAGGPDRLDTLVKRVRAAYAQHLQTLPGPNT